MQSEKRPTLGIFIPVYNEEENLDDLFSDLSKLKRSLESRNVRLKLLFHDNHSTDKSWGIITSKIASFRSSEALRFRYNIGYQESLTLAFSILKADAIVVYQSDRQDPMNVINSMVDIWLQGNSCVVGVTNNRAESFLDKLGRFVFVFLFRTSSDIRGFSWFTDFYLLDYSLYVTLRNLPLQNQFIRGRILNSFTDRVYIPYSREKRTKGKSKFNFAAKYSLALDAILLHASRVIRRLTVFSVAIAAGLIVYFLVSTVVRLANVSSMNSLNAVYEGVYSLFFSILLLLSSIALEYLRRVYYILQSSNILTENNYSRLIQDRITTKAFRIKSR